MLTICTHKQAAQTERKGKHRGKQNVEGGQSCRRRNSTEMCLGSSDDSQSSCLLASRFPFPSTPAVCVRTSFPSLPSPSVFPLSPPFPFPPPRQLSRLRLRVSLFCSSRTHRCETSIVLKLFHLLAPPPRARPPCSLHGILNGREFLPSEVAIKLRLILNRSCTLDYKVQGKLKSYDFRCYSYFDIFVNEII